MFVGISSSSDFDPSLDELLVVFGEPLGAGRVVGEEEQGQQRAENGDETFDNELHSIMASQFLFVYEETLPTHQPSEAFEASCAIHMSDTVCKQSVLSILQISL